VALRRSSSRDEVWLSAADMYTLLTVSLLAAVALGGAGVLRTIRTPKPSDMAIKVSPVAPTNETAAEWFAEWEDGKTCAIRFVPVTGAKAHDSVPVPCKPAEFGGGPTPKALKIRAGDRNTSRKTVMRCLGNGDSAMTNCARLMWTLIDAGFEPKVLVRQ
jgi:hypothetical protein